MRRYHLSNPQHFTTPHMRQLVREDGEVIATVTYLKVHAKHPNSMLGWLEPVDGKRREWRAFLLALGMKLGDRRAPKYLAIQHAEALSALQMRVDRIRETEGN